MPVFRACRSLDAVALALLTLLVAAQPSYATTFTVGSSAAIEQAISQAQPGDTIVVQDGVYDFGVRLNGANGTADKPITFKAQNIGGVVFTGSNLRNNAKLEVARDYWVVDGFTFDNVTIPGNDSSDKLSVIRLSGASYNTIRNVTIQNSGLSSANPADNASNNTMYLHVTNGSRSNVIERNRFADNRNNIVVRVGGGSTDTDVQDNVFRYNHFTGLSGFETLQLSWGSAQNAAFHTVVEHNLWEDNGSSSELISSKTSENYFRYNTFRNNNDQLVLRSGDGSVIESNYFLDSRGIRAYGEGHTIANNYFEGDYGPANGNLRGGILLGAGAGDTTPYEVFRNGTVSGNTLVDTGEDNLVVGYNFGFSWNGDVMDVAPYGNEFLANLIVNMDGVAIDKESNGSDANAWLNNYVWALVNGHVGFDPGPGVLTNIDPELLRNAWDIYFASALQGIGADLPYRPLMLADVGPGSTYIATIPEPATAAALGLAGLAWSGRRRRRA